MILILFVTLFLLAGLSLVYLPLPAWVTQPPARTVGLRLSTRSYAAIAASRNASRRNRPSA